MIPSEEGQAGVFDDQEVVNLVSPKAQLAGRGRGQRASEHIWFHLGAPSGDYCHENSTRAEEIFG